MHKTTTIIGLLLTIVCAMPPAGSLAGDAQKTDEKKGLTIDDLARGLKSAGQSIEKEIPKIGPAIGETFKKVTGKGSSKPSDDKPGKPSE